MASAKPYVTILWLVSIILTTSVSVCVSETETESSSSLSLSRPSPFDIMPKYGLPIGLLPDCVKNYSLTEETGEFSIELDHTCYIKFDYLVYYDTHISGTLKIGSVSNLKGIQVKSLFLWFDLDEIKVDLPPSDSIYFQVGIVNRKLDIHQFETIHSCRSAHPHLPPWTLMFPLPPAVDQEVSMLLTE